MLGVFKSSDMSAKGEAPKSIICHYKRGEGSHRTDTSIVNFLLEFAYRATFHELSRNSSQHVQSCLIT